MPDPNNQFNLPFARDLSRRDFLLLSALSGAGLMLPSCGGGNGSSGSGTGSNFDLLKVPLPQPAKGTIPRVDPIGALDAQMNTFSETIDTAAAIFDLPVAPFNLPADITRSAAVLSHRTLAAKRSDDPNLNANLTKCFKALYYGNVVCQQLYQKLARYGLHLDDLGHVSEKVTSNFSLSERNSVSNPQWLAAVMRRNYYAMRYTDNYYRLFQTAGINGWLTLIRKQEPNQRAISFLLFAHTFNKWIEGIAKVSQVEVRSEWRLRLPGAISFDMVPAEMDRVAGILPLLPLGPGFSASGTTKAPDDPPVNPYSPAQAFIMNYLGWAAINFFGGNSSGVFSGATWSEQIQFAIQDTKFIFNDLARLYPDEVKAITSSLETGVPGTLGLTQTLIATAASDLANLLGVSGLASTINGASDIYNIAGLMSAAAATTGLSAGVLYGLAAYATYDLGTILGNGLADLTFWAEPYINQAQDAFGQWLKSLLTELGLPVGIKVPAVTNPQRHECDQFRRAKLEEYTIAKPTQSQSDFGSIGVDDARALLGGSQGSLPRTFDNVDAAMTALIYDLGKRNQSTVNARIDGTGALVFLATAFALLIRRNPGSTEFTVPRITDAQLLCSSPGFVPMRTDGTVDTNTLTSLPSLDTISALGTGVGINVK